MKKKDYTLSLTVSTNRVGWACLLPDNRILKVNDRLAMGVHEFREAQTAEERRNFRSNRRIIARRKKRLQLTQEVFQPILEELHPDFLKVATTHRWQNDSTFHHNLQDVLKSIGEDVTKYPTMYHVRHDLMTTTEKQDLRLIFLAVYNLIKYRGHFNFKGIWGENNQSELFNYWAELLAAYEELVPLPFSFDTSVYQELDEIVRMNGTNKDKLTQVAEKFDKSLQPLISLILDMELPLKRVFPVSENYGLYKESNLKMQLSDEKFYEERFGQLTEHEQACVQLMQQVQQMYTLQTILGDYKTISEAKVNAYEIYSEDLKRLKEALNGISTDVYREVFISSKKEIKAYSKQPTETNFKQLCRLDRFLQTSKEHESFYKYVEQVLTNTKKDVAYGKEILDTIEKGTFLQRLKGRFNSSIPVQNNVYELQLILKNQQQHHPAITDEVIQQLVDIITFKIPFYVGPLSNGHSPHSWLLRKSDESITPFNFKEVVDLEGSNEKWIQSLIGNCSFVKGEKVLPSHSLLNQEFKLLNELNVVQFRLPNEPPSPEARITQDVKIWLLENVFKKKKTVTHKALLKALENSPYADMLYDEYSGETKVLFGTGKPNEFTNTLTSWVTFSNILGDLMNVEMVENIIYWLSVYSEKEFVEEKIKKQYPFIPDVQVKQMLQLNITGWGTVSHKFLKGIPVNEAGTTVLDAMRVRCANLSMLTKDFTPYLEKYNQPFLKHYPKFKYEQVEELIGSKAIKRGIWRTLKIVEELTQLLGEPKNIVLKVEREPDKKKKRTKTRREQWIQLGKAIPKTDKATRTFFEQYALEDESAFRNDAFWLYLTQLGRCAFTGKPMAFKNGVMTTIYPRNVVYDDSLANKVLIHKDVLTARPQGKMPLQLLMHQEAIHVKAYWETLRNYKLINQTKYYRLLKEEFTEDDRFRSVEQQLVERRQIVKNLEKLLKYRFKKSEIYTVRHALITAFRQQLELPRMEEINSKHAAMDALLAGLLVQFSVKKYGMYLFKFDILQKENYKQLHEQFAKFQSKFFMFKDFLDAGAFVHKRTNEPIDMEEWLCRVQDEYEWQMTKMRGKDDESFYDQTLYSPKVTQAKYTSDKTTVGVHSSIKKDAVYVVKCVEENKKGNKQTVIKLIDMTNIEAIQWKHLPKEEVAFLLAEKDMSSRVERIVEAEVLMRLEKGQKILLNGKPFLVVSSAELENATPLQLSTRLMKDHNELLKAKEWDNDKAIRIFDKMQRQASVQLGHLLSDSNIENMKNYTQKGITDYKSYLLGYKELMAACSCSPGRSDKLKFGGRYVKVYSFEQIEVVNESLTGLRYKKSK